MQQLIAHNNCCYKIYAFFGSSYVRYRKSLNTDKLFLEDGNDWYSLLHELSRKDLTDKEIEAIKEKKLLSQELVDLIVDEMYQMSGLSCFGLDILIEEDTQDFYLIDLNDIPSYDTISGIRNTLSRLYASGKHHACPANPHQPQQMEETKAKN